MKALVFCEIKKPLEYKDFPDPEIKEDYKIVELKAAALNRRDWWITQGRYANIRLNSILGSDGSGIFDGKEVVICPSLYWGNNEKYQSDNYKILGMDEDGTFAEKIAIRKKNIHPKPEHLNFEQAAALALSGLTAYRALIVRCGAKAGDNVLISGVGGGTALSPCQFAIALGANVFVTSGSEEKINKAIEIGAKGGVDYKDPDAMKKLGKSVGGFDVVIDSAGGAGFELLLRMCRKGANVAIYGGTAGTIEKLWKYHGL